MTMLAKHAAVAPAKAGARLCPACRNGHLHEAARQRVFKPHGSEITVPRLTMACDQCGTETTSASQHAENLRRLKARKEHYGPLLMGEEIVALRKRYGLTQQAASRIFGKGKIAFSRYENEVTYPDDSTTRLLAMAIAKPDALKWLADQAGEELPLWAERCEDRRLAIYSIPGPVSLLPVLKRSHLQAPRIEDSTASEGGWHSLNLSGHQPSVETVKGWPSDDRLEVAA